MAARARLRNRLVKNNAFLRQDQRLPIFGRLLELASPCARDSKTARSSGSPISRTLSPMSLGTGFSIMGAGRSEEHTSELQSLMRISFAVYLYKTKQLNMKQITT